MTGDSAGAGGGGGPLGASGPIGLPGARPFSAATRAENLDRLGRETFDVLIVGGGITGAGVARQAARAGFRVALVERDDFASGTSGRSTKLIHGGLRYLAQGEVGLVREAARERAVLRRQAPHLAEPAPVLIPVWHPEPPARLRVGLAFYDRLAGVPPAMRHRILDAAAALAEEPALRREGLRAAGTTWEFVTDDARLTLETVLDAHRHGAAVANHAPVVGLLTAEGAGAGRPGRRVVGATVRDAETGRTVDVRAAVVVNAAGPWVDRVLGLAGPAAEGTPGGGPAVRVTKGIHLVFPHKRLPLRHIVIVPGPDRRPVLVVPRGAWTYLGTTDTDYDGPLEAPGPDPESVGYLLETANAAFPGAALGPGDVTAAWAGLRPLIHEPGKRPAEVTRRDAVRVGPPGLVTVFGGKLTMYRRMAHRVLLVAARERDGAGREASRPAGPGLHPVEEALPGGRFDGEGPEAFAAWTERLAARGRAAGLEPPAARRLAQRYGARGADVLALVERDPGLAAPLAPGCAAVAAEVAFAASEEMALSLADVLDRRLGLLLFDPENGLAAAPAAAGILGKALGWDAARRDRELRAYRALVERHRLGGRRVGGTGAGGAGGGGARAVG